MRVNIYHHLLKKLQKSWYATALVENFVATFPETIFFTCSELLQPVLQLISFSIIGQFRIYLFQPNLASSFPCSSISVMVDGQAEKGKLKFVIRKEWG